MFTYTSNPITVLLAFADLHLPRSSIDVAPTHQGGEYQRGGVEQNEGQGNDLDALNWPVEFTRPESSSHPTGSR